MPMIADLIIIAVLIAALVIGVKRGLLSAIAGIVSVVAAFFGASLSASLLTPAMEKWLQPLLMKKLEQKLSGAQTADGRTMLGLLGFDGQGLSNMLHSVTERIRETGEAMLSAVAGSVAHSIAYAIAYLVSFVVLLLVFRLLCKLFKKMELPVFAQLDSVGGGILGLMEGALLIFVAVWVMQKMNWILTPAMIADSTILKFFAEHTPLDFLASLSTKANS
ncbi:MAG: CvpA family protein [Eubacteriales bacterium]|nr:CvpA family protein [Eubacteriales bacterium]